MTHIDHRSLYRLPWNLADNPIVWLEPTDHCNLACDGCYRTNQVKHKTLDQIEEELDVFQRLRTFDGVSIAGGDPLTHPEIVEIVRRIAARGAKPILNTNGHALTPELLRDLKKAGVLGFTFHVDSKQGRPDWKGKDEVGMNELRTHYAEMVASAGDIACAFNSTVYPDTIEQVPEVLDWARRHIDKVQTIVFIIFRHGDLSSGAWDHWAADRKVQIEELVYAEKHKRKIDYKAEDVVEVIRRRNPGYAPNSYLNGTEQPDSFKWLVAMRVGTRERIYGYMGPKFMETVQAVHHLFANRYMSYLRPSVMATGRSSMLGGALIDPMVRRAALSFVGTALRSPLQAARTAHVQGVVIIQPIDIMPDGGQNMCDGCPDITVHEGKLVWSCRLEEPKKYGAFLRTMPRRAANAD